MKNTRIIIAGMGGVGGYFGGLLAKHFHDYNTVEIIFYARGKHLEEIKANGLRVLKGRDEFLAIPTLATHDATEIGAVDFIILCTKSHDIEKTIEQLKVCIRADTVILPLLNGVDSKKRITSIVPDNTVLEGCVYVVSRLTEPGKVENMGNIETVYFGGESLQTEKMLLLEQLFKQAKLNATLSNNILSVVWEKFIFISPTATATAYYDRCIGEVLSEKESLETIVALIEEVKQVAKANHIKIPEDITEKTLNKLNALPFETTSSMHSDFKNKKPNNELQSLTGYVVREGQKYNIGTPAYSRSFRALKRKIGTTIELKSNDNGKL